MNKRSVTYEGMDCLKDTMQPAYIAAHTASQAAVPWTDQPKYAEYTVYFGCVVIFLALIKNVFFQLKDRSYLKSNEGHSNIFSSLIYVIVGYSRAVAYKQVPVKVSYFTSLPPSVGSSLLMIVSSFYLFCYCLIPHFWYRGCRGFGSPPMAVRAGVMATALTPFIYILAGKANMISFLTGVSYEKLNSLHQYVGVAAFILSIIHTIPFIYQPLQEGGVANLKNEYDFYYMSGIPPLVLLAWLCMASKKFIRKYMYECFLHLHWACGIAFFATLVWHINKSLDMQNYMWGALAFWATQLIYRMLVKTAFKPNSLFLRSRKGELKKLGHNSYQVTINNVKGLKWTPGQHCYLRFIGKRMLDNHPFSISSTISEENLKFIIVPQKGLTRALYNELDDYIVKNKKIYIDGPYGGPSRDVNAFDRVIMLASGSGVTVTIPFLTNLSKTISESLQSNKKIITQKIDFYWVVRTIEDVEWIAKELGSCVQLAGDYLNINIFVSGGSQIDEKMAATEVYEKKTESTTDSDVEKVIESPSTPVSEIPGVNIHYTKPNVSLIMSSLRHTLKRRNMIISSGSQSMKMTVSSAAASYQLLVFDNDLHNEEIEEVYLHSESFGW